MDVTPVPGDDLTGHDFTGDDLIGDDGVRDIDVAIIGAGPTGLFTAYYAGFRGLSVGVIDILPEPGGQITAMYPEKLIFDVGGIPSIRGRDLVAQLVEQADAFSPAYRLGISAD